MRNDNYKNKLDEELPLYSIYYNEYIKRLEFARDNGCNIAMLTGNGEPLANKSFLKLFGIMNKNLKSPFRWIELQTSGVYLDEPYLEFLRNHIGVNTISLSLSSLDNKTNQMTNGIIDKLNFDIKELCYKINEYNFNLRISLNLTNWFDHRYYGGSFYKLSNLFNDIKELGANQVTFRILYTSQKCDTPQDRWIENNKVSNSFVNSLNDYIIANGRALEILPYGATKWAVNGLSTVLDGDCMNSEVKDTLKYLILRPDCKLYSHWDLKESLIF